jgi:SAM-dependent methyltransferase
VRIGMFVAWIVAAALCLPAFAQGSSAKPPRSAAKKPPNEVSQARREQAKIYETRGEEVPATYVTDRALLSYASTLMPDFIRTLAELGPADRWLDIGAGQGRAVLAYYGERFDAMHPEGRERRGSKAQSVALSIEDRRTAEWHKVAAALEPGKISYLHGKRLREYTPAELGRFQLASDVYGGFSYTSDLSLFMLRILELLETGGSFYTLLINVQPETAAGRSAKSTAAFQTEILAGDGTPVKICAWLRQIGCAEVSCDTDPRSETPIERYRIRKTCDKVSVPVLEPVHFAPGTPPARQFRVVAPAAP